MSDMHPTITLPVESRDKIPANIAAAMDGAMEIASQSPMGRAILQAAQDGGLRIVYKPELCDQLQAGAGLDYRNNTIFFGDIFEDPLIFAITLCHEARHFNQLQSGEKIDSTYTPSSMLKMMMASEADARAYQIQVGLELAFLKDAKGDYRYPETLNELFVTLKEIPAIADLFDKAIENPKMLADGSLMKECFEGFYASGWLRRTYEDHIFSTISYFHEALGSEKFHTKTMDSAQILTGLHNPDYPYLKDNFSSDLLDRPFYTAIDEETAENVRKIRLMRSELTGRPENGSGWSFPNTYKMVQGDPYTPPNAVLNETPKPPTSKPKPPSKGFGF